LGGGYGVEPINILPPPLFLFVFTSFLFSNTAPPATHTLFPSQPLFANDDDDDDKVQLRDMKKGGSVFSRKANWANMMDEETDQDVAQGEAELRERKYLVRVRRRRRRRGTCS